MTVLYDAGWQGIKVRLLAWALLGFGVLIVWLAMPAPAPARVDVGAQGLVARVLGLAAVVAVLAGIRVYTRSYIGRVALEEDGTVRLWHPGLLGSGERVLRPGDVLASEYHHGRVRARSVVEAPWYYVHIQGRRLPLLLDVQGRIHDPPRLERALGLEPRSLPVRTEPPPQ